MRPNRIAFLLTLAILLVSVPFGRPAVAKPPNVLFIPVDDLNHWVGYTGRNPQCKTPNIDRLAAMGVSFTNAHCAAPACGPSRAALWSGIRPHTSVSTAFNKNGTSRSSSPVG